MLGQVAIALVGVLRAGEAGVLAHRPEPVAVHAGVDAAGEGVFAGLAEALLQPWPDVVLLVEALDLDARVGDPVIGALLLGEHRRDVAVQVLVHRGLLLGLRRAVARCVLRLRLVLWPGGHGSRIDPEGVPERYDATAMASLPCACFDSEVGECGAGLLQRIGPLDRHAEVTVGEKLRQPL